MTKQKQPEPRCAYCGKEKPAGEMITKKIWVNDTTKDLQFCDEDCAGYYQMGAEG